MLANYSRLNQPINVLDRLDLRLNDTHSPLRWSAVAGIFNGLTCL
jgi:hypothetical protein